MDLFQHRYYRTNKILLMIIGQWPYQSTRARSSILAVIIVGGSSQLLPQIVAIVKCHDDWEFLLKSASPLVFVITITIRLVSSIWNAQKMLMLLNRIRKDWQVWGREREVNIIHGYAEQGRKVTIMYGVMITSTCFLFAAQPVALKIIDVLLKNGSEPGGFAFPVDYYVLDAQKYYFFISMHAIICTTVGGIIVTAINAMFIVYVQHGCGLFAAVGSKLQLAGENKKSADNVGTVNGSAKRDVGLEHLVTCINHHNNAIEYMELINATYSWSFFFYVGCNVLMTSITGYQVFKKAEEPLETATFIICVVANMFHLYVETNLSQILMDHSIGIRYSIYNSQWYRLSRTAQKLLILMTMRCNVPCKLVAGKILTISIENFVMILRTTLSYFTLLRSI